MVVAGAEPITLQLDAGGESATIAFDPDAIRAASRGEERPSWRLEGELDGEAMSALRVISAAFDDGRVLALAAVRPPGAQGHGDESARAALVEADGSIVELAEVLISTEYDAQGVPARLGLELYVDPEAAPLRVAAERESQAPRDESRGAIAMGFRIEGTPGSGRVEGLTPG